MYVGGIMKVPLLITSNYKLEELSSSHILTEPFKRSRQLKQLIPVIEASPFKKIICCDLMYLQISKPN